MPRGRPITKPFKQYNRSLEHRNRTLLGQPSNKTRVITIQVTDDHTFAWWILARELQKFYLKAKRKPYRRNQEWIKHMFRMRVKTMCRQLDGDPDFDGWREEFDLPKGQQGRGRVLALDYCRRKGYLEKPPTASNLKNKPGYNAPPMVENWGPGRRA